MPSMYARGVLAEGPILGCVEGLLVGLVGMEEGRPEGCLDGAEDGRMNGCLDGSQEGCMDGRNDGELIG